MDNSHQALCYRLFVFPIQRVSPRVLWQTSSNQPRESVIGLGTSEPLPRLQKTKLGTLQEWLWQSKLTLKHQLFHFFPFYDVLVFIYVYMVSQIVGFTQSQTAKSSHGWDKTKSYHIAGTPFRCLTCMPGTVLLSRVCLGSIHELHIQ